MTPPHLLATLLATAAALQPERLFVGGLGYCGLRIAETFRETYGCAVAGCVRSAEKQEMLAARYPWLETHVLDLDNSYSGLDTQGQRALAQATHVIETVAPIADFDEDPLLALHADCFRGQWVAYLSSTGVYGDHDGRWIDEDAACLCTDAKSQARVQAELDFAKQNAVILRLGGIYGPGRSLFDAKRRAAPSASEKPVNRVHVDDIAGALLALVGKAGTYNVVDDDPAPRGVVSAFVDELLGPASTETKAPKPSRGTGSKRCRNAKLRGVYDLVAPTYREGLMRIRDADGTLAAAARRQARIQSAQQDLQAVALADQRADVESGETYWMRDKYQELQKLAAEDPEPAA